MSRASSLPLTPLPLTPPSPLAVLLMEFMWDLEMFMEENKKD